jgi:aminomethyltransferase
MAPTLQPAAIPTPNPDATVQLSALLTGAAVAPLDSTGWIRVTGSDRVRWLNGMVTNNIQTLAPGQGCYNFVLNAQGRIQGDLTAFLLEDSIFLETTRDQIPALLAHLDRFIIMDDVELTDITENPHGILLAGPQAASILHGLKIIVPPPPLPSPTLTDHVWLRGPIEGFAFRIATTYGPLIPRFEIWSFNDAAIAALTEKVTAAGATAVTSEALEALRILSGTPRYGTDIRNTATAHELPQETAPIGVQSRALHFTKGCYLGQEIVERIHSRGNVHRTFAGFQLTGALPTPGTVLTADSDSDSDSHSKAKPVGELTSVAAIPLPTGPVQLALGYIRREALPVAALDRNLPLQYPGGTATPIALPYRIS